MLPILLLVVGQTAPQAWTFHDDLARDGRSMVTFRAVELGEVVPRPLHPDDKPPAGAKFGDLRLGPGGSSRRLVVWHAETATLWLDADGDGRFANEERHTLGKDPLEVRVRFPAADSKATRTVILKRRGDGLAAAVRGYMEGSLTLAGQTYKAVLTDGDADGCFDSATADRVWIDLDRDGKFDPLTEQFPLGAPLAFGGTSYLLKPDAGGTHVGVRERPTEAGTVRLTVARAPGSQMLELNAQLVSEWGELVTVETADKALVLPVGRYRVEAVRLRLKDADGREWMYRLSGPGHPVLTIAKGRETAFDVSGGIRIDVGLGTSAGGAKAGDRVRVRADVVTKAGLAMTECEVSAVGGGSGRPARAAIRLVGPGSAVVDEAEAQFL